jgi:surface antigen
MNELKIGARAMHHNRFGTAFVIAALAVGTITSPPTAHAQIYPFRGLKGPSLPKEDLTTAAAAARKLLDSDPPEVGQMETWVGSRTGNQGTLTIREVFDRTGMPCRKVLSQVVFSQSRGKREYTLTACRIASGQWKLAD